METTIRSAVSVGLLAYSLSKFENSTLFYAPAIVIPALVSLLHFPTCRLWRFASSLTIVGAALFLHFFVWTVVSLQHTQGLDFHEARYLLPIAIAMALIVTTRINHDTVEKPIHYVRSAFFHYLIVVSVLIISSSPKLYFE
ncbi:unnamed protein product [Auanema sp. JU1783]|nr:unnamed protein product [Auanema sp. JU1783]